MYIDLLQLLQCPLCHGGLAWSVNKKNGENIISGKAECDICNSVYRIEEGIAYFLEPKYADLRIWQRCDRVNYKKLTKSEENSILNKNITELTSEEILLKIAILENGISSYDDNQITELYEMYLLNQKMEISSQYIFTLMDELIKQIQEKRFNIILDFATGRGLLAEALARNITDSLLIFSDINPIILQRCKQYIDNTNYNKNISYIAFDMKKSPIANNAADIVTTLLGMQNIPHTGNLLQEIFRVCRKEYYSISSFCCDKHEENDKYLKQYGMLDVWAKEML